MDRTKKLPNGTTVTANIHGRPKGARKVQLAGGMYYLKRGDDVFVYEADGEFVTALRSVEQARAFAEHRHADPAKRASDAQREIYKGNRPHGANRL